MHQARTRPSPGYHRHSCLWRASQQRRPPSRRRSSPPPPLGSPSACSDPGRTCRGTCPGAKLPPGNAGILPGPAPKVGGASSSPIRPDLLRPPFAAPITRPYAPRCGQDARVPSSETAGAKPASFSTVRATGGRPHPLIQPSPPAFALFSHFSLPVSHFLSYAAIIRRATADH